MRLIITITFFIFSINNYAQKEKPNYEFEIIRTNIVYKHNVDTTLTKSYNNNKELLNGKYKIIHEDSTETYVNFKKGLWDGLYKSYSKNGEIYAVIPFENGIKIGIGKWYYPNGNKRSEISYLNGEMHGNCKWYYENGHLAKKCEYIANKENGICKWFYKNGSLKALVTFKNGIKNGMAEQYNKNGKSVNQVYFLDNKQISKREFNNHK